MVRRVRRGSSPHIVRLVTAGVLASASPSGLRAQVGPQSQPPKQPKAAQQALVKGEGAESCGRSSAVYWAGSGPRVNVTRRGVLSERKPLEPKAAATESIVVEVRISGKLATAHGPSFDAMRRAGPPSQLEEETGSAITWANDLSGLPKMFNILAEEGPEVVARLRFEACGARLAAPPERIRPARKPDASSSPKRDSAPTHLPQGAIQ
jgi:hypothetical protein